MVQSAKPRIGVVKLVLIIEKKEKKKKKTNCTNFLDLNWNEIEEISNMWVKINKVKTFVGWNVLSLWLELLNVEKEFVLRERERERERS